MIIIYSIPYHVKITMSTTRFLQKEYFLMTVASLSIYIQSLSMKNDFPIYSYWRTRRCRFVSPMQINHLRIDDIWKLIFEPKKIF